MGDRFRRQAATTSIDPALGTVEDFAAFVAEAGRLGMEVALDYALQCSPDHPWVTAHPEWFSHRPDGSIRFAENPPKQYQDIYPINFFPEREEDRVALWTACLDILRCGSAMGCASSGSTTRTPNRSSSGRGSSTSSGDATPRSSCSRRRSPARR